MSTCFCMGPQKGDTLCPCQKRASSWNPAFEGPSAAQERDHLAKQCTELLAEIEDLKSANTLLRGLLSNRDKEIEGLVVERRE